MTLRISKHARAAWEAIAQGDPSMVLTDDTRKPRAAIVKQEAPRQRAVVNYLRRHLPQGSIVAALTNHSRSREQTFFLLSQGMVPGMPDLLIFVQDRVFGIEMKAPKGRLSANQERVQAQLVALGVPVLAECTTPAEAHEWLTKQGVKL